MFVYKMQRSLEGVVVVSVNSFNKYKNEFGAQINAELIFLVIFVFYISKISIIHLSSHVRKLSL